MNDAQKQYIKKFRKDFMCDPRFDIAYFNWLGGNVKKRLAAEINNLHKHINSLTIHINEALDAKEAAAAKMNWIKASEHMPEDGQHMLGVMKYVQAGIFPCSITKIGVGVYKDGVFRCPLEPNGYPFTYWLALEYPK